MGSGVAGWNSVIPTNLPPIKRAQERQPLQAGVFSWAQCGGGPRHRIRPRTGSRHGPLVSSIRSPHEGSAFSSGRNRRRRVLRALRESTGDSAAVDSYRCPRQAARRARHVGLVDVSGDPSLGRRERHPQRILYCVGSAGSKPMAHPFGWWLGLRDRRGFLGCVCRGDRPSKTVRRSAVVVR